VLDLDDFKIVNDGLGHAAGDSLLVAVAERLTDTMRGNDVVARLGGDEFAIVLDDVHAHDGVVAAAERIIAALRAPFPIEGHQIEVRASIGIVTSDLNNEKFEDQMHNADVAMYIAKSRGKAHFEFFEASMLETDLPAMGMRPGLRAV
jgi:diguanylate cyclase (GGDEF)-like protein